MFLCRRSGGPRTRNAALEERKVNASSPRGRKSCHRSTSEARFLKGPLASGRSQQRLELGQCLGEGPERAWLVPGWRRPWRGSWWRLVRGEGGRASLVTLSL